MALAATRNQVTAGDDAPCWPVRALRATITLVVAAPPGFFLVLFATLLPWLTVLPISGHRDPTDVIQAPARLLTIAPYFIAAAWIARRDRWLGLFVGYVAAYLFLQPGRFWFALEAQWITVGALGLVAVRDLSANWRRRATLLLAWGGALEAVYVTLTAFGINPLGINQANTAAGTLGHSTYAAAFLAITAPLAPPLLLPFYVLGLLASHSGLAVVAASVGVIIAHRKRMTWQWCALGGACSALAMHFRGPSLDSLHNRLTIWALTWRDLLGSPWIGWGFGGFSDRMIGLQMHAHAIPGQTIVLPLGELFDTAHNEWLQLAYCGGLVALVMLAGWLVAHRGMFRTPYAGSVVALGLVALGTFPFRLAAIAATALVLLGLATAPKARD